MEAPTPCPCARKPVESKPRYTLGLPRNASPDELRFPLTPEGAAQLVSHGVGVLMEKGGGGSINYADRAYLNAGVEITSREAAFSADVVAHLGMPAGKDIMKLRPGVLLLTSDSAQWGAEEEIEVHLLLNRRVTCIDISLIKNNEYPTFSYPQEQAAGCGAIAVAVSMMTNGQSGNGILLGGVTGVPECEVLITGSGQAARSAAKAAMGAGALVRMLDDDVNSLNHAKTELGPGSVVFSSMNCHVLEGATKSADVIITTSPARFPQLPAALLKKKALLFDLSSSESRQLDGRPVMNRQYVLNRVSRTASMALSNSFVPFLKELACNECGIYDLLKTSRELQQATLTCMGRVVNPGLADLTGLRGIDMSFLSFSF